MAWPDLGANIVLGSIVHLMNLADFLAPRGPKPKMHSMT